MKKFNKNVLGGHDTHAPSLKSPLYLCDRIGSFEVWQIFDDSYLFVIYNKLLLLYLINFKMY